MYLKSLLKPILPILVLGFFLLAIIILFQRGDIMQRALDAQMLRVVNLEKTVAKIKLNNKELVKQIIIIKDRNKRVDIFLEMYFKKEWRNV